MHRVVVLAIAVLAFSALSCAGPAGPQGPEGQQGAQGAQGVPGAPGAPGVQGTMIRWGSDPTQWHFNSGTQGTLATNTSDVLEGDSSFEFSVTSGTTGSEYVYGDYVPVDPRQGFAARVSAKLTTGSGTFSAGVWAYDSTRTPLASKPFLASSVALATGTWTTFSRHISGEGTGTYQFPPGTRFIRPFIFVNENNIGTTLIDALDLMPAPVARWVVCGKLNDLFATHELAAYPSTDYEYAIQYNGPEPRPIQVSDWNVGVRVYNRDVYMVNGDNPTSGMVRGGFLFYKGTNASDDATCASPNWRHRYWYADSTNAVNVSLGGNGCANPDVYCRARQ